MGYRHYLLIGCLALPFVALTQAVAQKQEPPKKDKEPVKVAQTVQLWMAGEYRVFKVEATKNTWLVT